MNKRELEAGGEGEGAGAGRAPEPSVLGHSAQPSNSRGDQACSDLKYSQWQNQNQGPSVLIPSKITPLAVATIPSRVPAKILDHKQNYYSLHGRLVMLSVNYFSCNSHF